MRFLPKPTCEKLVKMGLKSESEAVYHLEGFISQKYNLLEKNILCPAFTLEDFVSTDEYAKENCRKIWGDESICTFCEERHGVDTFGCDAKPTPNMLFWGIKDYSTPMWDFKRHEMIRLGTKDWVEFIREAVEEYEENKN